MAGKSPNWDRIRVLSWLLGGLAAAAVGAVITFALLGPLTDLIARHDVGSLPLSQQAAHLQAARETVRTQLLTLGAGLFAAGALVFTARNFTLSRRMYGLTEQGQVTDRFTKAIDQLGSGKLEVRLGGIYALERIARDSARDHPTVMDVLCAFIREQARESAPARPATDDSTATLRADVQAAISVLGRRDVEQDIRRYVKREGTWLISEVTTWELRTPLQLEGAELAGARLSYANLSGAVLSGADFSGADLTNANLGRSGLESARFTRAVLTAANFGGADLSRADFTGANLSRADFSRANLTGAVLTDAYFLDTDITETDFSSATWPSDEPAPDGWELEQLTAGSGQLRRAGTRDGPDAPEAELAPA